jgi:hypothetical protein
MKIHSRFAASALFALAAAVGAQAFPLDVLASHADAIVIASVMQTVVGSDQVSYTLNIARTFKGSLQPSTITVIHSVANMRIANLAPGPVGIWFLTQTTSGTWDVLVSNPSGAHFSNALFLPASTAKPTGPFAYGSTTPMVDALVYEVAAGIQNTPSDPVIMTGAVDRMDTPAVKAVLSTYLASADPGLKSIGLALSLERGVPGVTQQLSEAWGQISADRHAFWVSQALRDSWRDPTPAAVTQMAAFASAAPLGSPIRAAAIRALAAVHTRETVPFLASLLSSSDSSEQERAIYGVSAFANGCPIQTNANATSMTYLTQCNHSSTYSTPDTVAHFAFGPGSAERMSAFAQFWQGWWSNHPELH